MPIALLFSGPRNIAFLYLLSSLSFLLLQSSSGVDDQDKPFIPFCALTDNNTATKPSIYYTHNLISGVLYQMLNDDGGNSYYYNTTGGEYPDEVYGLYVCMLFVTNRSCLKCISDATNNIVKTCNGTKEATIWYEECLVRYSYKNFFSTPDTWPFLFYYNQEDADEPDKFSRNLKKSLNEVIAMASSSKLKYATWNVKISRSDTLYSLAQCIPGLSKSDCSGCLQTAVVRLVAGGILKKKGARIYNPSCVMRYEMYPFFANTTAGPPETNKSGSANGNGTKAAWIAIGVALSALTVVALFSYLLWHRRRRLKRERMNSPEVPLNYLGRSRSGNYFPHDILREENKDGSQEFPLFPLDVALQATQHFSDENKLGEGGFGPVYKGILADGREIAVKRLSRTSGQGLQEFKNEVTLIAKLQHKNLVRLFGCCLEGNELLLIYEYMPNKSLDFFLFDSTEGAQLDWKIRKGIIKGIARGLMYLHEDSRLKIIHRDLKASNILLDHGMNPKISDFGMARIFGVNQNEASTNRVVGTYGYMAPEYAMEGLFSVKSDVFSFGVLLLEILSGRRNNGFYLSEHGQSLLTYTWKLWCEGHTSELIDPVLVQSFVPLELLKLIHIGLLCVQEDPTDRPTMSSVVVMLASDTVTLPIPTQPAFSVGRIFARSAQLLPDNKICSVNEVTLSDVSPR